MTLCLNLTPQDISLETIVATPERGAVVSGHLSWLGGTLNDIFDLLRHVTRYELSGLPSGRGARIRYDSSVNGYMLTPGTEAVYVRGPEENDFSGYRAAFVLQSGSTVVFGPLSEGCRYTVGIRDCEETSTLE